jgi:hypothetical protein
MARRTTDRLGGFLSMQPLSIESSSWTDDCAGSQPYVFLLTDFAAQLVLVWRCLMM